MLKEYKIQQGDNPINVAGKILGGFDNIISMIQQSEGMIVSVDDDLNSLATQKIPFDDSLYQKRAPELIITNDKTLPTTGSINAVDMQGTLDLCLEAYGDLDNYIAFLMANNINGTDEGDMYGKEFIFELSKESSLRKELLKRGVRFTSLFEFGKYRVIQTGDNRIIDTSELRIVN